MTYLERKKLAFMSIVNKVKGFIRTVSGVPPLTLPDCVDEDSLINYTISGNSVQNGTPTLDAPIEVESVGEYDEEYGKYKIPVVCSGKNIVGEYNYIDQTTRYSSPLHAKNLFTLKQGITYTISFDTPATQKNVAYAQYAKTEEGLKIVSLNGTRRSITITPKEDITSATVLVVTSVVSEDDSTGLCSNCMIEIGTAATDYEPYVEPVTTSIFLDEPLKKYENIEYENQLLLQACQVDTLNSSLNWNTGTGGDTYCKYFTNHWATAKKKGIRNVWCSHLATGTVGYGSELNTVVGNPSDGVLYFCIDKTICPDLASWKNFITDNQVKIYFEKANSAVYTTELPKPPTIKGTTIYTVGTNVQPSNMSATYYSKAKE